MAEYKKKKGPKKPPKKIFGMKEKGNTVIEMDKEVKLDEASIKDIQSIAADVLRRQRKGIVFILASAEEEKDGKMRPNGVFFTERTSAAHAVVKMMETSGVNILEVMQIMQDDIR